MIIKKSAPIETVDAAGMARPWDVYTATIKYNGHEFCARSIDRRKARHDCLDMVRAAKAAPVQDA